MRFRLNRFMTMRFQALLIMLAGVLASGADCHSGQVAETKVPVTFTGGHDLDPRDNGRPVVLIAAALGVKAEVFREAFRGVTPAGNRQPTGEEARRNKEALMKVLAPY